MSQSGSQESAELPARFVPEMSKEESLGMTIVGNMMVARIIMMMTIVKNMVVTRIVFMTLVKMTMVVGPQAPALHANGPPTEGICFADPECINAGDHSLIS